MNRVISVALDEDLTEFTEFLWKNEIPHRVVELEDCQELWISHTVNAEQILKIFRLWQGGHNLSEIKVVSHTHVRPGFTEIAKHAPLTVSIAIASIFVSLITGFGANNDLLSLFTFTDYRIHGDNLYVRGVEANFETLEIWRFFSPMLIHFSAVHIIFNLLWVWIVGTRMEIMQGYKALLGLILFAALISNISQYVVSGPMFGGLSGVVFALLGYAWLWDKRNPAIRFGLPPALMGFMVVWLLLGYLGVLEGLGFGAIANTAHLMGLLAGLIFVPIGTYLYKR
ncbi:MAG: rhomboid family intramembrane serine protease [Neptuniibacter sp.]